jgi:hypothetical protein
VPPHVENAILAALRGDPSLRPMAEELVPLLRPSPPRPEPEPSKPAGNTLVVPPSGETLRRRLPGGEELLLRTLPLLSGQQPTTLPLSLVEPPDSLPAELLLLLSGETIQVELADQGRGRDRPSLYHDAREPSTRCDCLTLLPSELRGHFDVGHRRSTVAGIGYASSHSTTKPSPLTVKLDELGVAIDSAGPLRRLTVVYTKSASQPLWYGLCLCLG